MTQQQATPKQIAYLGFIGHQSADRLTKDEASQAIESLADADLRERERI